MPAEKTVFPHKALIFVASYSFAYGIISSLVAALSNSTICRTLPALLVMGLAFVNPKSCNLKTLYNVAFPTMVCGMLLVALVPGLPPDVSFYVLDASFGVVSMMIIAIACGLSYSIGASAIRIFGILVAVQFVSRTAGQALKHLIEDAMIPVPHEIVTLLAMLAVVLASITMVSERSIFSNWGARESSKDGCGEPERGSLQFIQMRIESLGEAYGLTKKEIEVVRLLAMDKNNSSIANDMFIAEGTVKAHIQHVYQKNRCSLAQRSIRAYRQIGLLQESIISPC